jgi:hypothetical protein
MTGRTTTIWVAAGLVFSLQVSGIAGAQQGQTLKERLSDKATDNQRVDNCHVPPDRRGALARPDCPEEPHPSAPGIEAGAATPKNAVGPK